MFALFEPKLIWVGRTFLLTARNSPHCKLLEFWNVSNTRASFDILKIAKLISKPSKGKEGAWGANLKDRFHWSAASGHRIRKATSCVRRWGSKWVPAFLAGLLLSINKILILNSLMMTTVFNLQPKFSSASALTVWRRLSSGRLDTRSVNAKVRSTKKFYLNVRNFVRTIVAQSRLWTVTTVRINFGSVIWKGHFPF